VDAVGSLCQTEFWRIRKIVWIHPHDKRCYGHPFQILITRQVKRHRPEKAMIVGAIFYAVSVFAVAFGRGFWAFWLCMVVATIGEMILVPTSTTYASLLAPEDMRGRLH